MADDKVITVPAAFGHALVALDKHYAAAKELTAAITAINEHQVDIDDDAMAAIEQERFRHSVAADAIADALQVVCKKSSTHYYHKLNASELYKRACFCGAKIEVEGEKS